MGLEDEISKHLQAGYTPQQVISMGYKKSTVYKVCKTLKTHIKKVGKPKWLITDITFFSNKPNNRCLPGEKISVSFNFENASDRDMYLSEIGIWVEWLKSHEWYAQNVKDLTKSGQKRFFSFLIPVPDGISLGEYELRFGVKAQYLPVIEYQDQNLQVQWSEPEILHIKHPFNGVKIFISHSTRDMTLVRQLEQHLDNYGFEPIIAEDIRTPGALLREKFEEKIREATILLVLFTEESITSKWVIEETNYSLKIGKPIIPLKEESVRIKLDIEWIEFSKYDKPEIIFSKIMDGINNRLRTISLAPQVIPAIAVGLGIVILAFLAGFFIGSVRRK